MPCFRLVGVLMLLLSFSIVPAWAQRAPLQSSTDAGEPAELEADMQRTLQTAATKEAC